MLINAHTTNRRHHAGAQFTQLNSVQLLAIQNALALRSRMAHRLFTTGLNDDGACLVPALRDYHTTILDVPTIAPLETLPDGKLVVRAATGGRFTLLLDSDAGVWSAGCDDDGQLGQSNRGHPYVYPGTPRHILKRVVGIDSEHVVQIAAGERGSAAVTESGQLLVWGDYDSSGYSGADKAMRCTSGALADADVRVAFAACGTYGMVTLTRGGGVINLGYTALGSHTVPTLLTHAALTGVRVVGCAVGDCAVLLVSEDGCVYDSKCRPIDAQHFGGAPIVAVAAGERHMLALTAGGHVYAWGGGEDGATGLGHTSFAIAPQRVLGALADARVVRISAGFTHSQALTDAGQVFMFGTDGAGWTCDAECPCPWDPFNGPMHICNHRNSGSCKEGMYDRGHCTTEMTEDVCTGTRPIRWLSPHLLQDALADATVCALGNGSSAEHSVFVPGAPPSSPGFDPLLAAVQKPAAKQPDPAAVAAAGGGCGAMKQQQEEMQHEGGGAAAASATASDAKQGPTRKRKASASFDDDSEGHDAADDEGGDAEAAPLC